MKKFFQWGYVKRHFASKGIADIVCIRKHPGCWKNPGCPNHVSEVAFIQCKYSKLSYKAVTRFSKSDKKTLIDYARDCGAVPIFAYSECRNIVLINLLEDEEFIP